jgi:2-methylisocitrate lyase-like PEP mutase family enzyme
MSTQIERGEAFRSLHQRDGLFVLPNPWDAGSAKMLAALGFEALATTSAGLAFSLGRCDAEGAISREEALANARAIVEATPLPVAADLENGYGDDPQHCAETIALAAQIGLVGGSIEDATGDAQSPIYPFELAVERIQAAVAATQRLPFTFTLAARAENYLHGRSRQPAGDRPGHAVRAHQQSVQDLSGCEKTPAYCDRLQTVAAARLAANAWSRSRDGARYVHNL